MQVVVVDGEVSKLTERRFSWTMVKFTPRPLIKNWILQSKTFTFSGHKLLIKLIPKCPENELWLELRFRDCCDGDVEPVPQFQVRFSVKRKGQDEEIACGLTNPDGYFEAKWMSLSDSENIRTDLCDCGNLDVICELSSQETEWEVPLPRDVVEPAREVSDNNVEKGDCSKSEGEIDPVSKVRDKEIKKSECSKSTGHKESSRKLSENNAGKGESSKSRGSKKVLQDLKELLISEEGSDVILKVNDSTFRAHKNILRARCPSFHLKYAHKMVEEEKGVVVIKECSPEIFPDFLHYIYTGDADNISSKNVSNLYETADKYSMKELKEECVDHMKTNLSIETICDVLALSLRHSEKELLEMATDYFCKNLKEVILTVKWQNFLCENPISANELLIKALAHGNK